jgi:hypothetical protein
MGELVVVITLEEVDLLVYSISVGAMDIFSTEKMKYTTPRLVK